MDHKRPQTKNGQSYVTTPGASTIIALLGSGFQHEGVTLNHDEHKALSKLYGFKPEKPNKKPPKPEPLAANASFGDESRHNQAMKAWENWKDPIAYYQAGADRNMFRHAEHDGLRLIAWLAKHVPEGEDPLKTLIQAVIQAGWDVPPEDVAWAGDESFEEQDEEDAAEE